jgi:hypothetical protein
MPLEYVAETLAETLQPSLEELPLDASDESPA